MLEPIIIKRLNRKEGITVSMLKAIHGVIRRMHKPYGKFSFVSRLKKDAAILDVGCGNNSPFWVKQIVPNCHYTGIDIGDCNQTLPNMADRYIITAPEEFTPEIAKNANSFDAVISSHNLEHCNDREGTLQAMLDSLKSGGLLYLSFPSEKSVHFPKRGGTLCYYDDATHRDLPPDFNAVVDVVKRNGFDVIFAAACYQPILDWCLGMLTESRSRRENRVRRGTRAYYGFDAVIWARKRG